MEVCQQERLEKLQACALQGGGLSNGGSVVCLFWFQWFLLRVLLGNLGSWWRESLRKEGCLPLSCGGAGQKWFRQKGGQQMPEL